MSNKVSVFSSNRFWQRSALWTTSISLLLFIWLTFDSISQISMGTKADVENEITKRVPSATAINYKINYEMDERRAHNIPIIKAKEKFFGRDDYSEKEANELVNLGKLTFQSKNCISCHTIFGKGSYYAPDLTKAWVDSVWNKNGKYRLEINKNSKEESMAEFLINPSKYPIHKRVMPNLNITKNEAIALVAFLKHSSSIDTNGFPKNFTTSQGATNDK